MIVDYDSNIDDVVALSFLAKSPLYDIKVRCSSHSPWLHALRCLDTVCGREIRGSKAKLSWVAACHSPLTAFTRCAALALWAEKRDVQMKQVRWNKHQLPRGPQAVIITGTAFTNPSIGAANTYRLLELLGLANVDVGIGPYYTSLYWDEEMFPSRYNEIDLSYARVIPKSSMFGADILMGTYDKYRDPAWAVVCMGALHRFEAVQF